MTDNEIRNLLMEYTQEAANAKESVGMSIMDQISAEPVAVVKKPKRLVRRLIAAVVLFVLTMAILLKTPPGQAFADYTKSVIEQIFQPKEVNQMLEGIEELDTLYPYGEIVESDSEGLASYVIYIDETYDVEQWENMLRVTFEYEPYVMTEEEEAELREMYASELGLSPEEIDDIIESNKTAQIPDLPEVYMEITQVRDTTVEEMAKQFDAFTQISDSTEDYPYKTLYYQEGQEYNSVCKTIEIRDNECGGVFMATTQYFLEATEGHGQRLRNALSTLEIIG